MNLTLTLRVSRDDDGQDVAERATLWQDASCLGVWRSSRPVTVDAFGLQVDARHGHAPGLWHGLYSQGEHDGLITVQHDTGENPVLEAYAYMTAHGLPYWECRTIRVTGDDAVSLEACSLETLRKELSGLRRDLTRCAARIRKYRERRKHDRANLEEPHREELRRAIELLECRIYATEHPANLSHPSPDREPETVRTVARSGEYSLERLAYETELSGWEFWHGWGTFRRVEPFGLQF